VSIATKVLSNVFSNWASLLLNLVISFFLAPFVVNRLGSTYYGIWVIMMQLTGYLYLLDFGVRESVIRYVSKYNAEDDAQKIDCVINSALILYSIICFLCIVTAAVIAYIFPFVFKVAQQDIHLARIVVLITGINLGQFFVFNVFTGVLMGLQRYDIFNKVSICFALVRVALIVYFLNRGYGIIALATIQLGINVVINLINFALSRRILKFHFAIRYYIKDRSTIIKQLVNYSFFVLLINICQKIIFYTDALVIGYFLPAAAITYYAIAGNLIEYLRRFVITMASVLNPLISELESRQDPENIIKVLIQGTKFSLLIGTPICAVYYTMGKNFIQLWMGAEYALPAASVLSILAVTHLFSLPHYTVSSVLYGLSRHKIIAYSKMFEAVANILLSIVLVKSYGIVGVAYGTAIPHLISVLFVFPVMITRMMDLSLKKYLLSSYTGPLISAVPFIYMCFFLGKHHPTNNLFYFFGQILLILPIYIFPAWFVSFSKEERKWHLSLLSIPIMKLRGRKNLG
jgi:O-antigen/teichoic acid export membrane protein